MNVNRNYKDSVFSLIFSNPDTLRELYCALKGVTLPEETPIIINTLKDVLYKEKINDISFVIGDKLLVLIEHQSTINRNIALRLLSYITRLYEKIIPDKKIYSTTEVSVPRAECFVLYNGASDFPNIKIYRLSTSFRDTASFGLSKSDFPLFELKVKVININKGRNKKIVRKCKTLAQYSEFMAKIRYYEKEEELSLEESIEKAVKYCRNHDILKEFLEEHTKEIINMLITTEWNWDDAKEVWKEEGREEGREEIARNALAEGFSVEMIQKITGLSPETINQLSVTV